MKNTSLFGAILLLVAIIIFFPFAVVWSLNTLFALSIPYTFWTWLAVFVLSLWFNGSRTKSKK